MTQLRHIRLRGGIDVRLRGAPRQEIGASPPLDSVGILVTDYPGVRPALRVAVGDAVRQGQIVFVDRRRPAIAVTSPVAGSVRELRRDDDERLTAVVIELAAAQTQSALAPGAGSEELRTALLAYGLWPAFVTRPFGDIPDPDAAPDDILVTAIDTAPLAPDPQVVIAAHSEAFHAGVDALRLLARGRVIVCQGPGPPLEADAVVFVGRHPAGLPGTHVRHLCTQGSAVWHIGYQDAIAIGYLHRLGRLWTDRIVAVAGPAVREPRLVCAPLGARLSALLPDNALEAPRSGEVCRLSGRPPGGRTQEFLGRHHLQVTALFRPPRSRQGPIIPIGLLERAAPGLRAPVPLLRALSIGDEVEAVRLGALALVEDDVELLSYACPSGADYGALLRNVLERSRASAANWPPSPAIGDSPPVLRAGQSPGFISAAYLAALAPPLLARVYSSGAGPLRALLVALVATFVWQSLFAWLRRRPLALHGAVTAASLALLCPDSAPLWQIALGASFGVVFAEQAFGGYGYNFLHPGAAALAFLAFSFPDAGYGDAVALPLLAVGPGAALLVAYGFVAWSVLCAFALACVGIAVVALGGLPSLSGDALGTLAFAVVFLGADPVCAAATRGGRWVYGLSLGALVGLGLARDVSSAVFPIVVAQVFAPLIDRGVLAAARARGRRDG